MAISHADHDHPNTPTARAACRKQMAKGDTPLTGNPRPATAAGIVANALKPAKMTVVPRTRGDGGVVQGLKNTTPKPTNRTLKRTNTKLKAEHDLADMPRMLGYGVRLAWAADLDVVVGDRFNEVERRVVIKADLGEISLVWKESNPEGLTAIWVRNYDSSIQYKVDSVQHALEVCAHDATCWDEYGKLKS